ncbi:hypothetical protein N9850_12280 [Granulosicoccus sp.]|nr:hypothetical protein [Granulosicoccus sp.]MDB4224543.1 hypothetical protein [Granulosicoccus sp.]
MSFPYQFEYLMDKPIIDTRNVPSTQGNINGPSLIKVPSWVENSLGKYYLYFAHHEGLSIRLLMADSLAGPWKLYEDGVLHLHETDFCQIPPTREDTHPRVLVQIDAGMDGDYAHIASPDVHFDEKRREIYMYFHGRVADGTQCTKLAVSNDGLQFQAHSEPLGLSYFRVFEFSDWFYAIALGGQLYRSKDGRTVFEAGPKITTQNFRHCAIHIENETVYVLWSRPGDDPERILVSTLNTTGDWQNWTLEESAEVHAPEREWEGLLEHAEPSIWGGIMSPVKQLRDPAIYREGDKLWLLYSIAGEQGLAIGRLAAVSAPS